MGKFRRGQAKPKGSGRAKGTPNKQTRVLVEALDAVGLNVVERLSELMPKLPATKQADILVDLLGYLFPKRKAVELVDSDFEFEEPFTDKIDMIKLKAAMAEIEADI